MRVVDRVRSVVMNESRLHVHSLAQSTKGNIDMSSESKFESIELLEIEIAMDKYRSAVSVRTFEQTTEKKAYLLCRRSRIEHQINCFSSHGDM